LQNSNALSTPHAGVAASYAHELSSAFDAMDVSCVNSLLTRLTAVIQEGRGLFLCGNGGSAATAMHIAYDLSAAALDMGHTPCRVHALSDSPVRVTAIANDMAYEDTFARQLAASLMPGDALLVLSVSGESPNVVAAAKHARESGLEVLAVVGQPSTLGTLGDVTVVAGGGDYGLSEDIQLSIGHMAVRMLRRVRRFTCSPPPSLAGSPQRSLVRSD